MKIALLTVDNREVYRNYTAMVPHFSPAPEALLQGFASIPELEVHVISCTQKPMKSPEKLTDNTWFHSLYVPKVGWMRTSYQGCIRAVRRKLKVIRPDLVHGQGTERECALSAVFSRLPNVLTVHGNMVELARLFKTTLGSFGWLAAQLENITLKRTRGVFCNSEYTENLVKPRASRTWRVPNAIRAPFFEIPKVVSPPGKCVLMNVGVISERKRQVELLEVARRLHEQGLNFELQFVGHADPKSAYGDVLGAAERSAGLCPASRDEIRRGTHRLFRCRAWFGAFLERRGVRPGGGGGDGARGQSFWGTVGRDH